MVWFISTRLLTADVYKDAHTAGILNQSHECIWFGYKSSKASGGTTAFTIHIDINCLITQDNGHSFIFSTEGNVWDSDKWDVNKQHWGFSWCSNVWRSHIYRSPHIWIFYFRWGEIMMLLYLTLFYYCHCAFCTALYAYK